MPRIAFVPFSKSFSFRQPFDAARYKQQSLHIYRSLLRECSYLPDEVARQEISRQVKLRFRAKLHEKQQWLELASTEAKRILQSRLASAQSGLQTLSNANEGSLRSLLRVLRYAYGRSGRRRRELMEELLIPDHAELGPKSSLPFNLTPAQYHIFEARTASKESVKFSISSRYGRLRALAESQARLYSHFERLTASNLKSTSFSVPALNIWKRPISPRRVKNIINKRYAWIMERIYAPLPRQDWMRLRDLALGKTTWPGSIQRRARKSGFPIVLAHQRDAENLLFALDQRDISGDVKIPKALYELTVQKSSKPDSWLEYPEKLAEAEFQVLQEELDIVPRSILKKNKRDSPHILTPRLMRRVWAKVFHHCPLLEKDKAGKWTVTWGEEVLQKAKDAPILSLVNLFDMVTETRPQSQQKS